VSSGKSIRLKHVARIRISNVDKKSIEGQAPVRLCNYTDVYYNEVITDSLPFAPATATPEQIREFSLLEGDVLITKDSETPEDIAVTALVDTSLPQIVCGYHLALLRPIRDRVNCRYLFWSLKSTAVRAQFSASATGVTRFGLRADAIGDVELILPELEQQRMIASFLDAETTRIDQLATAMIRQVELLDIRRYAVVEQHLDSLRAKVKPLKYLASIVDTEHKTAPSVAGGGFWIAGTSSVRNGRLVHSELYETDHRSYVEWTRRKEPKPGDVLLSREAPVGEVAIYRPDDPVIAIGQRMVLISADTSLVRPDYLLWALLSDRTKKFTCLATQGSLHPHLNMGDIGSIPIRWVPLDEQETILNRIEDDVEEIETLRSTRRRMLALLAERRQALITVAVTGEIDVTTVRRGAI